jgi:DNA polymerase III epsilon subunit-like protein
MKAVIFDTETTGFPRGSYAPIETQPHLLQFAGALVDLETGDELNRFVTFVKNVVPIPEAASKVNGITDEMLKDAPLLADVIKPMSEMLLSGETVIAHNIVFDISIMDIALKRGAIEMVWPRAICTMQQSMPLQGRRLKLMALYEHLFKEKFENPHSADGDVAALKRIVLEMYKMGAIK